MQVKAKLNGTLVASYPAFGKMRTIELKEGDSVKRLRERLFLEKSQVYFIVVNGSIVGEDFQLSDGDEVAFFPIISGG